MAVLALWAGQAMAALQIRLQVGKAEGGSLPLTMHDLDMGCVLSAAGSALHCDEAKLSFRSEPGGVSALRGSGEWSPSSWKAEVLPSTIFGGSIEGQARYIGDRRGKGETEANLKLDGFSFEETSGRYATDKAQLALDARARFDGAITQFEA